MIVYVVMTNDDTIPYGVFTDQHRCIESIKKDMFLEEDGVTSYVETTDNYAGIGYALDGKREEPTYRIYTQQVRT